MLLKIRFLKYAQYALPVPVSLFMPVLQMPRLRQQRH
jgi:hypothetical protein